MNPVRLIYGTYCWLLFVVVIFMITAPALILAPTLTLRRHIGRLGVRTMMLLGGMPLRLRDSRLLPDGPCIVAATHASYIDGILLTAVLPHRFTFVVQHGAASWPYIGLIIKRMGVSFVTRDDWPRLAGEILALLRRHRGGESLAVFPEGTFVGEPGLLPFKDGAFFLAAHAGTPVAPVIIEGTRNLFEGSSRLPGHSTIRMRCLAPILPGGTSRAEIREFAARCREAIASRYSEPVVETGQDAADSADRAGSLA